MTLIDMTMRPVSYLACMKCNADLSKKGTKACSGCHSVFYDDVVCQKNDWPIHKTECKAQQRQVISIVRARFPEVDTMPKLLARPDACGIIAKSYKYGEDGLEKNAGLSVFWTMQWVKGGYPEAMEALGLIYTNGSGVSKNESKGTELLLKAANLGHASAQYEIGRTYVFKYDNPEAAKWFRKAAEGGHAEAAFFLAHCFKSGDGLGKDLAEAAVWYRKSADLGYVEAECEIGRCYERGLGVEKDLVEAALWYRKSADQGNARGQFEISRCFQMGLGVDKDFEEAMRFLYLSSGQGYDSALAVIKMRGLLG